MIKALESELLEGFCLQSEMSHQLGGTFLILILTIEVLFYLITLHFIHFTIKLSIYCLL